ncbi:protein kinase [Streptomyces sp. NPDC091292]|uniref:protein kinase n=1 Tax=Streptomyces sp. NPDC091292 TaxID=3365991 RepID=UPI0037FF0639
MDDLPDAHFRDLIHPHTGTVTHVHIPDRGFSADYAAVITGEAGRFFVKAMFNEPGGRLDSLHREQVINPYVRAVAPRLLWSVDGDEAGWVILGFEAVTARSSRFESGSPDLPAITDALNRVGEIALPGVAAHWAEDRWDSFATDTEAALLKGDALLHTDIAPSNIMIGAEERTWVVDWSWPTHGAAMIDPAILVVQLISAGHSPAAAETWAARCRAWTEADPKAIDAFAAANARLIRAHAERYSDATWMMSLAESAQAWAGHRGRFVE